MREWGRLKEAKIVLRIQEPYVLGLCACFSLSTRGEAPKAIQWAGTCPGTRLSPPMVCRSMFNFSCDSKMEEAFCWAATFAAASFSLLLLSPRFPSSHCLSQGESQRTPSGTEGFGIRKVSMPKECLKTLAVSSVFRRNRRSLK